MGATKLFLGCARADHAGAALGAQLAPRRRALGLLAWGTAAFAIVPPVQTRVMHAAAEAPGLASSINIGAFNLGNALGAAVGGAVLSAGLGYAAVPLAGALLAAAGFALVWIGSERRIQWLRCAPRSP